MDTFMKYIKRYIISLQMGKNLGPQYQSYQYTVPFIKSKTASYLFYRYAENPYTWKDGLYIEIGHCVLWNRRNCVKLPPCMLKTRLGKHSVYPEGVPDQRPVDSLFNSLLRLKSKKISNPYNTGTFCMENPLMVDGPMSWRHQTSKSNITK